MKIIYLFLTKIGRGSHFSNLLESPGF